MTPEASDPRAPMASAPMRYTDDGAVDWGTMWTSFCALAAEGGPPHRGTLLLAPTDADATAPAYQAATTEIIRGIKETSGLDAAPGAPGWIAVQCSSAGMAGWLADAIVQENVQARADSTALLVPVAADFTVKGEIKNVITAVAKTTHYWREHLPTEVQRTLILQAQFAGWKQRAAGWFRRK